MEERFAEYEQSGREFGTLDFFARQVVEGFITGLHKSPYHGFSVEFAEHRQYNKGQSTRHIDWKLYARTDKLFVKRYEEETNLRCYLILDTSGSMYFPVRKKFDFKDANKLQFSVLASAAIMNIMKKQRDAVGLSIFNDQIESFTPARTTTSHHRLMFHELEKYLHPFGETDQRKTMAIDALHQIAEKIHKRSLVVLFTDMFDDHMNDPEPLFSALQHLKYNKHEVLLFHVTDRKHELDFEFENRPYQFVDMETGDKVKLNPNEIKDEYTKRIRAFKKELTLRCGQYGIEFVEADISRGYHDVLLSYLLKRKRLY